LRRVVCDTGPILHLREAGLLPLLHASGSLHIPAVVGSELLAWGFKKPEDFVSIEVVQLGPPAEAAANQWVEAGILDLGEAQALALATQIQADWFLTDDAAARLISQDHRLEVHGSLGVLLWAAATGLVGREEAEVGLLSLSRSSLWVSARVLDEATAALRQIFSQGE